LEQHRSEPNLRGLLIIGDGADNGTRYQVVPEAAQWRSLCPINCFALGQSTTSSQQKDIAVTSILVEPAPVYVKGRMVIRVKIDAYGLENSPINPLLYIDDKDVPIEKMYMGDQEVTEGHPVVTLTNGNELRLET